MKINYTFIIVPLILAINCFLRAQDEGSTNAVLPEVKIAGTQLQKIHSAIDGQDYDLYINLPRNYNDTTKTFPVLYVLDGQWDFPLVSALYGSQYYDGFVPAMVVVGITWSGANANYDSLRARDFTPASINNSPQYGNAPKFLQFIKNELIPFVESKYRVTKDRALVGSSFGGLFTLYTLFNETNLFDKYILTSPALAFDNGIIYKYEQEYADKNKDLPVRLYIGIGQYEDVSILHKFEDKLKSRNYKNLNMKVEVIESTGHSGAKAYGFTKGLQYVYQKPSIKVDPEILKQYAGNYGMAPNFIIKVEIEGNHLIATEPGGTKITLYAESNENFYAKGIYLLGHFIKDSAGKVTGIQVEQYAGSTFIKKL